jgi:hypothetical protein
MVNTQFATMKSAKETKTYTVWNVDTVAKRLYWYNEIGTLNDFYQSKVSDTPRRILSFQKRYKNEWQPDCLPDKTDSTGIQEYNYGIILSVKVLADKLEIHEKSDKVLPYFYYENKTANELTKAFVENPMITQIATHWNTNWESEKIENGVQYKNAVGDIRKHFGRHLYFNIDGSFTDVYYAPCGLDGNIHRYNGKWKLTKNNTIAIYDLVEEYNKAHWLPIYPNEMDMVLLLKGAFKILKMDDQTMNLQIVENYEQMATYKVKKDK